MKLTMLRKNKKGESQSLINEMNRIGNIVANGEIADHEQVDLFSGVFNMRQQINSTCL